MEPYRDRSAPNLPKPDIAAGQDAAPELDVPGMLADRIGDLYASEESRQRHERSQRMIERAEGFD